MGKVKPELFLYAALGLGACYMISKKGKALKSSSLELGSLLGGLDHNKISQNIMSSLNKTPILNNPTVQRVAQMTVGDIVRNIVGEKQENVIDAEYRRIK